MAESGVRSHRLTKDLESVFRWRMGTNPIFPGVVALVVVGLGFAFLITSVRIQVAVPEVVSLRKASVIYLQDDPQGRALSLRAQEGGPFPSRFEPAQWEGLEGLEVAARAAAQVPREPYVPALVDLPAENRIKPMPLANKGVRVFPSHPITPRPIIELAQSKITPTLYPLSGISQHELPEVLPNFETPVTAAMSSASWRFLIRLTAAGVVAECVSLEKGGESGAADLEAWLHRISFTPAPEKPVRWIALGIGFTNTPTHGTDAH